MNAKATEVVPAPPPLSPAKAKKKSSSGWDRAKSKRRASTLLMLRVKQAKEQMEKEMLTEAETIEKDKIGLKFAHIMYILKQQIYRLHEAQSMVMDSSSELLHN